MRRSLMTVICLGLLAGSCAFADEERLPMIWPAYLKPGDTIMFVSPAGPAERDIALAAKERIEARGYKVKFRDDCFAALGYLAGSDQRRSEEMMEAFLDPEVKAIFTTRGGYGVMRMLSGLDYDAIRKHPKVVTGYSDITALHAALNRRAGLVTFHGPGPASGLGGPNPPEFVTSYFWRAIEGPRNSGIHSYVIEPPPQAPKVKTFGHGKARGRLVGGNLSLVSALEGTPYAIDSGEAILLIEDVSEAPYRIDRMLQQLKLAGKLKQIRGAVLGQFTRADEREEATTEDPRFTVDGVLEQYFENAGIPVLANFPLGHFEYNCTLPLGGEVEIDADKGTLTVFEP